MLLIVSGLMVRTFIALREVDPGFVRAEEVQTFRIAVPAALIAAADQTVETFRQIADRLAAVPGVTSVGLSSSVTMDGNDSYDPAWVEHVEMARGQMPPLRRYKWVAPGYVETMGNRLLAGRTLTWDDSRQKTDVVMVSENFAREHFKEPANAIGKRLRLTPKHPWFAIVGVVGNERDDGVSRPAPSTIFWPMAIKGMDFYGQDRYVTRNMAYVVRTQRAGVALGVLASVGLTRAMTRLLFGVTPVDPLTYAIVAVSLGVVAVTATYLPARRAARIDPIVALRSDG